jgi:aldose 1-epimerase
LLRKIDTYIFCRPNQVVPYLPNQTDMFSIHSSQKQGFQIVSLTDENNQTTVDIAPACGALLHAFTVMHKGSAINVIDSYASKAECETAFEAKGFKSAKLSPFVCRLKNGSYRFGKRDYKINKFYLGNHAIHGIIYDQPFEILSQFADAAKAKLELCFHYKGQDEGYPFPYDCTIVFELTANNNLTVSTSILNTGIGLIPVCDGWHPYFSFGSSINDCQLEFQSKEMVLFDEDLIPTGRLKPWQEFGSLQKIGDTFFDNCFTVNFAECQPMLIFRDAVQAIQLEVRPEKSYPYLQVYTPEHRKSIAIENLSAAPDAFNNGMGLITLAAGEQTNFSTTYTITSL